MLLGRNENTITLYYKNQYFKHPIGIKRASFIIAHDAEGRYQACFMANAYAGGIIRRKWVAEGKAKYQRRRPSFHIIAKNRADYEQKLDEMSKETTELIEQITYRINDGPVCYITHADVEAYLKECAEIMQDVPIPPTGKTDRGHRFHLI